MTLRNAALSIARAALKAADPYDGTRHALIKAGFSGKTVLLGVGKAAVPMTRAALDFLGDDVKRGLVITKDGHLGDFSHPALETLEAAHPVPDERSLSAGKKALALADGLTSGDTLLVLLSGGGSALMEDVPLPLSALQRLSDKLLRRGAGIEELNAVRRALSNIKGGALAGRAYPARVVTVALSDVLGSPPAVIASGPTFPSTPDRELLENTIKTYLSDESGDVLSLLKEEKKPFPVNDGGYYIAGDLRSLLDGAKAEAERLGFETTVVSDALSGEARDVARRIVETLPALPGKHAFLWAGETTVTVKGTGKGGRNQEMALAAALKLEGKENAVFLSIASDGTDGPTDAAGGVADGTTAKTLRSLGLDPEEYLANNDAYPALASAGALLVTGPTGTNVNDLTLVLTENLGGGDA